MVVQARRLLDPDAHARFVQARLLFEGVKIIWYPPLSTVRKVDRIRQKHHDRRLHQSHHSQKRRFCGWHQGFSQESHTPNRGVVNAVTPPARRPSTRRCMEIDCCPLIGASTVLLSIFTSSCGVHQGRRAPPANWKPAVTSTAAALCGHVRACVVRVCVFVCLDV